MRIWLYVSLVSLVVALGGCEVKARVVIDSTEQESDEYSEHYKHDGDMFYKGTFVIKETVASVLNTKGNKDTSLRTYRVLGTDVEFQTEVVDTELTHDKLLSLKRQGYRIIIK